MCPKLIELLSWNGPTVHVYCFMLSRASTKTFVSRIHIRQPSPKTAKKSSLAEKFISRVTRQPRYHCSNIRYAARLITVEEMRSCFKNVRRENQRQSHWTRFQQYYRTTEEDVWSLVSAGQDIMQWRFFVNRTLWAPCKFLIFVYLPISKKNLYP